MRHQKDDCIILVVSQIECLLKRKFLLYLIPFYIIVSTLDLAQVMATKEPKVTCKATERSTQCQDKLYPNLMKMPIFCSHMHLNRVMDYQCLGLRQRTMCKVRVGQLRSILILKLLWRICIMEKCLLEMALITLQLRS